MASTASFDVEPLIAAAARAPSSHNTQPWRFRREGDCVQVLADRTRALPVSDPDDRELTISCGAALFNLRVAAAVDGFGTRDVVRPGADTTDAIEFTDTPDTNTTIDRPELLASIALGGEASRRLVELGDAIESRRTHRGAYRPEPVDADTVAVFDAIAGGHRIDLRWVPQGPQRDALAGLVAEATRLQFADPAWRSELVNWMKPAGAGDGLRTAGLGGVITRVVVRSFDVGKRQAATDAAAVRSAPLVGVLSTVGDSPAEWLAAGEALEHLLLAAASRGLQARYANQPCQVEPVRAQLRAGLDLAGSPQLVVLLGAPADVETHRSVRRPLDDVLVAGATPQPSGPR